MPGFDRTGPNSQGPMTGRGMGQCGTGVRYGNAPQGGGQAIYSPIRRFFQRGIAPFFRFGGKRNV